MQRWEADRFPAGSKVWLSSANIRMSRLIKKLDDWWFGPFEVIEKVGVAAYRLKLLETLRVHPVFNETLLRKWELNRIPEWPALERPDPEVIDGEPEYEIKEVLNS